MQLLIELFFLAVEVLENVVDLASVPVDSLLTTSLLLLFLLLLLLLLLIKLSITLLVTVLLGVK